MDFGDDKVARGAARIQEWKAGPAQEIGGA
jgi:hypothetical protein